MMLTLSFVWYVSFRARKIFGIPVTHNADSCSNLFPGHVVGWCVVFVFPSPDLRAQSLSIVVSQMIGGETALRVGPHSILAPFFQGRPLTYSLKSSLKSVATAPFSKLEVPVPAAQ